MKGDRHDRALPQRLWTGLQTCGVEDTSGRCRLFSLEPIYFATPEGSPSFFFPSDPSCLLFWHFQNALFPSVLSTCSLLGFLPFLFLLGGNMSCPSFLFASMHSTRLIRISGAMRAWPRLLSFAFLPRAAPAWVWLWQSTFSAPDRKGRSAHLPRANAAVRIRRTLAASVYSIASAFSIGFAASIKFCTMPSSLVKSSLRFLTSAMSICFCLSFSWRRSSSFTRS